MATVGGAVKITNFKVPASYIIEDEEKPNPLILDCEYKLQSNETGIVISWNFGDTRIYQWIVEKKPPAVTVLVSIYLNSKQTNEKFEHSKPI